MKKELEYTTKKDEFYDYCHYKYAPADDFKDKLRSNSLLWQSFDANKCNEKFFELVEAIKKGIGKNKTVWGVKKNGDKFAWEFYFYNYRKADPKINISNILEVIGDYVKCNVKPNENIPYFMFSIDITPEALINKKLDGLHVYITDRSYFFNGNKVRMENNYSFYKPKEELNRIISNIKRSAHVDFSKINIKEIFIQQLAGCKSICVAKKQENEGIYYSGINIAQFLFFLKKFDYPEEIIRFIESNIEKLNHLKYDFGFDYKMEGNKLKFLKSGYYGTF